MKYTKKQIEESLAFWEKQLDESNNASLSISAILQQLKDGKQNFGNAIDKFGNGQINGKQFIDAANTFYDIVTFSMNDLLNTALQMQNSIIGRLPDREKTAV